MTALSLTFAAVVSPAALALDTGDIVITSIKGEVHVTVNGAERAMKAGGVLETPSSIRTGLDGAIELRQGATSVSVGPDTQLEFPAQEQRGGPIDRIVQPRGNAFYGIGKRTGRKLRVETPYLVGVIKGTQFNVAAQEDSTTISLFEGRLEVHATDDSDVVDLNAGEIAARRRGANSIDVMKMDGQVPHTAPRPPSSTSGDGVAAPTAPQPALGVDDSLFAHGPRANPGAAGNVDALHGPGDTVDDVRVDAAAAANAPVAAAGNAGASDPDAGVRAIVATPVAALDDGVSVPVGSPGIEGVNLNAGSPSPSVDVAGGVNAGNPAASVDVSVGVIAGNTGVTVDVGVNVSSPGVELRTGTNVDVTPGAMGAGPAAIDVAAGTNTQVAVDTSTTVAGVDAGVAAAVNATADTVDLGLNVNANVGAAVDLGLDNAGTTTTTTTTTTTETPTPVIDVGGLLDGLLRHRRK